MLTKFYIYSNPEFIDTKEIKNYAAKLNVL